MSFSPRLERPPVVEADLANAPEWIDVPSGRGHVRCEGWPGESLRDWHIRHGLLAPKAQGRLEAWRRVTTSRQSV